MNFLQHRATFYIRESRSVGHCLMSLMHSVSAVFLLKQNTVKSASSAALHLLFLLKESGQVHQ